MSACCGLQEFEQGTADGFSTFPQKNGMLTCYNLLFVSPFLLFASVSRHQSLYGAGSLAVMVHHVNASRPAAPKMQQRPVTV